MAVVYEARDTATARSVALKVLNLGPGSHAAHRTQALQRMLKEASAAISLVHPNIVAVYEAGEWEGAFYLAMELLRGVSLRTRLRMEGKMPAEQVRSLALQVCSALEAAHSKGIIHRDLKPDNLILLADGTVKLTDFGIAQTVAEAAGRLAGLSGTLAYMSPEQVSGAPLDARTDIFSLGATLYEALTGESAFAADNPVTVVHRIITHEPDFSRLPQPFARLLPLALAKDPNQRFQSAAAFRHALEDQLGARHQLSHF